MFDKLLQADVYAWDPAKKAWEPEPIATSDRGVADKARLWQHNLRCPILASPCLVDGHVYGTNETSLLCLSFKTGKVVWQERCVGKGSVAYADGNLYVRGENGKVALVEANPASFKEKGQFTQPDRSREKQWPHPIIAGGKLYLRDWDSLFCYEIAAK